MSALRWGVIGASSRIYRNALKPAIDAAEGHELVAEASRVNGDESSYSALLNRDDVDAVYIPLPNAGHRQWILDSLAAGKHVLCEKPLTMSAADTEEVFAAAAAAGRVLIEAYMWPHHTRARTVLALAAGGAIGTIHSIRAVFTYPAADPTDHRFDARGGGALFDVGIYCLAPAMMVAGRDHLAVAASATRNEHGADVAMTGFVDWGEGLGSTFEVSFQAPTRKAFEMTGTTGVLSIPANFVPGPTESSSMSILRRDDSIESVVVDGASAFVGMVNQFAAVVEGSEPPLFGPTESIRLARVIDALHAVS